jgi:hypothetical protein
MMPFLKDKHVTFKLIDKDDVKWADLYADGKRLRIMIEYPSPSFQKVISLYDFKNYPGSTELYVSEGILYDQRGKIGPFKLPEGIQDKFSKRTL